MGLAALAIRKKDYHSYYNLLEKVYEINPKHPVLLLKLAEHYFVLNDYKAVHNYSFNIELIAYCYTYDLSMV